MNTLTKNQFISNLRNHQLPAAVNRQQYETLKAEQPEVFKPSLGLSLEPNSHRWVAWGEFFDQHFEFDIKASFSHELIEHLLKVKAHLQEKYPDTTSPEDDLTDAESPKTSNATTQSFATQQTSVQSPIQSTKAAQSHFEPKKPNNLENFVLPTRLEEFLKNREIAKVRTDLMSILNNRRMDIKDVVKCAYVVYNKLPEVFEAEEDSVFVEAINSNEQNWSAEYFRAQQVYLNQNFSLTRLFHLINVRETLLNKGDPDFQPLNAIKSPTTPRSQSKQSERPQPSPTNTQGKNPLPASQPKSQPSEKDSRFVKTALLVGGAVAVAVLAILILL